MIPTPGSGTTGASYHHEAVLYDGLPGFVPAVEPFVRAGFAAGEAVLALLRPDRAAALAAALGRDAGRVAFIDMENVGRNPARIIPAWRAFVDAHPGRAVRGIGEPVWAGRAPAELVECENHEALMNRAFAGDDLRVLCPYDVGALPPETIAAAQRTHPLLSRDGRRWPSPDYVDGAALADRPFGGPLDPAVPADAVALAFDAGRLADVRRLVEDEAGHAGLGPSRAADLVLAVAELAANSVRHGGGSGVLRVWTADGHFVCEVADRGRLRDPLAGRVWPGLEQTCGRGLWMVNQLCDLVQLRSGPPGTVARVWMAAGGAASG